MRISQAETIIDEKKFVKSHEDYIKAMKPNLSKPYKLRLEKYLKIKEDGKY